MFLLLILAQAGAPVSLARPVSAYAAGVAPAPAWRETAVREATAQPIAADLPATPQRFRFQCLPVQFAPYVPQRCIDADAGLAVDTASFDQRARREAAAPATTAVQRLRRAAWLRAMFLSQPLVPSRTSRDGFLVEVDVGARDLPRITPAAGELLPSAITWETPPQVEYPAQLLREGVTGVVRLACRIRSGALACRIPAVDRIADAADAQGGLSPDARRMLYLREAAYRSVLAARVGPRTRDGRPTDGMDLLLAINFRMER